MNMRTLGIVFAGFLVAALGPGAARAATTQVVESGSGASIDTFFTSADQCIQIAVFIDPATSVTRGPNGSTGSGMDLSMFYDDLCNDIFEFGFTTVGLTNEFQMGNGNHSATLNVTVPITTFDDFGGGTDRVVVANVQLQATSDTSSGNTQSRFDSGSGLKDISNGHSVSTVANVTGQISVDGLQLLPAGSVTASIETSMNVFVSLIK
jgi:hypothetical protein